MVLVSCAATAGERARPLPGDVLVPEPLLVSTHAITIDAPPERVWPWLVQMGGGRAGWYSWDRIDNGGVPSAHHLVPRLQSITPGGVMPALPGATDAFVVAAVDPPRDLVLTVAPGPQGQIASWEHHLAPLAPDRCRLIARSRISGAWITAARTAGQPGRPPVPIERVYRFVGHLPVALLRVVARLGHRFMEVRHLRGIKRRAEAGRALDLVERLRDRRGRRVIFLSHCLLDENARYLGGACRPGCVEEIVQQCVERGVGIVQMPCPEQRAWGGVLKPWMLLIYGRAPGGARAIALKHVLTPIAVAYTRRAYRRLARRVAGEVQDALRSGIEVVGIVGVDGSPSCGVERTLDVRAALPALGRIDRTSISVEEMNALVRATVVPGPGLFITELRRALRRRGCQVPFLAHDLFEELEGRPSRVQVPAAPEISTARC